MEASCFPSEFGKTSGIQGLGGVGQGPCNTKLHCMLLGGQGGRWRSQHWLQAQCCELYGGLNFVTKFESCADWAGWATDG
eukprot:1057278-Karenia_brevis.AAC.1